MCRHLKIHIFHEWVRLPDINFNDMKSSLDSETEFFTVIGKKQ